MLAWAAPSLRMLVPMAPPFLSKKEPSWVSLVPRLCQGFVQPELWQSSAGLSHLSPDVHIFPVSPLSLSFGFSLEYVWCAK